MSVITGDGYGRSHDWEQLGPSFLLGNAFARSTAYKCRACSVGFHHAYSIIPGIGEAMFKAGVPDQCLIPTPDGGRS